MKRFLLFAILLLGAFSCKQQKQKKTFPVVEEKPFVIVIPSYNNSKYCERNISSVLTQNYTNYRVIYIDDNSRDDTYEKVQAKIADLGKEKLVTLLKNETNRGALENIYKAIHSCKDNEIIVTVDGDDYLAHEDVLLKLNSIYANPDVWMSYGNYLDYPAYKQKPLICKKIPKKVIKTNGYRKHEWVSSHLRTFYAGLFKKIKLEDFLYEGRFLPMGWDLSFMLPLLEMSGEHCVFVKEILYLYNRTNPINDHKVNFSLQSKCADHVRNLPPYKRLESL